MEPEKSKPPITRKAAAQAAPQGKSQSVEDDKASLVKAGKLPSFMQRRTIPAEEEKEKWLLKQKALQMQKMSSLLFHESEKKKK